MEQRKSVSRHDKLRKKAAKDSAGFIALTVIPLFLVILVLATAVTGCISYTVQVMTFRNKMVQANSLLEEDNLQWQQEIFADSTKWVDETTYEKVVSTRDIGPYVLFIKEFRDRNTGKILLNRLEFIPIEKTDDRKS